MSGEIELASYPGLDARIQVLRLGTVVDAVFVRTERFDVLVDTLDTPGTCRTALDLVGAGGDRPLVVVNSHMDWDHFWGNAAVAGHSMIVAHAGASERFRNGSVHEVLARKASAEPRFATVELHAPTVTFPDRLSLDGGDLTLELLHTPGHAPDHVAVWIPQLRTCLAVDAVERPIPKVWSDDPADLRALVGSLRLIESLRARHVVLAHGQTDAPSTVARNLRYFETLFERIGRLDRRLVVEEDGELPAGLTLADTVEDLPALSADARQFYERFHRANLRATVRAVGEGAGPP
ncbi:MBL fold metallo-hydrolase [uncultured Aureimonas sp.]|uniref:MBL fold metallo-hydrolase n=1 Tax=uncultured Aureimonas sp. TaxID=1604662 RepID=UPI0025E96013|nr:MBL fold metallo-hydrolase [uncultured Aureimonas sp.]